MTAPDVLTQAPPCGQDPDTRRWVCNRMTTAGLCEHCAGKVGGWLAELGSLFPRLPDALAPGKSGEQDRVSGSREAPLPVRLDALSLLGPAAGRDRTYLDRGDDRTGDMQAGAEPVLSVLGTWVRWVAQQRHLTHPDPVPGTPLVRHPQAPYGPETARQNRQRLDMQAAANAGTLWLRTVSSLRQFLARHHDWTRQQPEADRYAADVHDLWRASKAVLGDWPAKPDHLAGVPCKRCDAIAMYRHVGVNGRVCDTDSGGCGYTFTDDDWDRWTKLMAHWAVKVLRLSPKPFERSVQLDAAWLRVKAAEDRTGHVFGCECETCEGIVMERAEAA